MADSNMNIAGRQRFSLLLASSLLGVASLVSWFSVGDRWTVPPRFVASAAAMTVALPEEMAVPPGPHRGEFQSSCVICHSPRLALTQPTFPAEKWTEIVHKMVAAYGAPLSKDEEPLIVAYLMAAQAAR